MNLYVWSGRGVVEYYGTGIAFACAPDIVKARELVRIKLREYYYWLDLDDADDRDAWYYYTEFLEREPAYYYPTDTIAFVQPGSE